jgi:hypothetical protein
MGSGHLDVNGGENQIGFSRPWGREFVYAPENSWSWKGVEIKFAFQGLEKVVNLYHRNRLRSWKCGGGKSIKEMKKVANEEMKKVANEEMKK